MTKPPIYALIPAAGVGRRMGEDKPKQYLKLLEKTILEHTLQTFIDLPYIEHIILVLSEDDAYWPQSYLFQHPKITVVAGGEERCYSVLNGLAYLQAQCSNDAWVMVHDVARPCVRPQDISQLIECVDFKTAGGLLATQVSDTIKQTHNASSDESASTIDRSCLWQAQTPQYFSIELLYKALQQALNADETITDEASAIELLGYQPQLVDANRNNIKITRPEDMILAKAILQHQAQE